MALPPNFVAKARDERSSLISLRSLGLDPTNVCETGSNEAFKPAQRLYESFGFAYCGPFGEYMEDPHSVFMTMRL